MPIQIQVPGIGVAEFPDGVSYDDAFKAIQEDNPEWQPSRADIFSKMQSDSNALASRDTNRFLKQEGDSGLQVAYERMAGNVTRGVGDILSAPVRLLEKPLDSYYAGERRAAKRTGADMPVTFEQRVRSSFDESADAAETATQGRGNAALNFGADVVGGIAPTLAATALTGGLGGALFAGAQQFGSTRKRVLDYYKSLGLPDDDAQSTADMLGATSGVITGAVTKYTPEVLGKIPGIGKYIGGEGVEGMAKVLLTQRLRQTPVAEIARRAVGNSFGEATEESINQFLLEVVESKQLEPNLSWEEIAKRTAMAGAQGAAGGAGTSIVGDVSRAGVERLSGTTPQSEFEYLAKVGRFENAKRELDKNRASRNELDTIREQSANELAQMVGFEKPHVEPKLPLPTPQKFAIDQDAATRDALAKANAFLAKQQDPAEAQPPLPAQSAPQAQSQPQVVGQSAQPNPSSQVLVGDKMVRAIGVKSLIARGVDPGVAASFVNLVAPTIQASTTEDARGQINAAFDKAGLLDSGANTFNTEANIRNAQAAEGWNESDVQNMLYDRRARDKEIADHNRKIIAQLNGLEQSQSAAQPPPLPAPQTPNLSGGESTNEGQIQEKGLQVAPATTPPPSSTAGEVVQPQSQPNTSNAVSIPKDRKSSFGGISFYQPERANVDDLRRAWLHPLEVSENASPAERFLVSKSNQVREILAGKLGRNLESVGSFDSNSARELQEAANEVSNRLSIPIAERFRDVANNLLKKHESKLREEGALESDIEGFKQRIDSAASIVYNTMKANVRLAANDARDIAVDVGFVERGFSEVAAALSALDPNLTKDESLKIVRHIFFGSSVGVKNAHQGNPQPQVPAGTQAKEAQGGSATGLESNPPDRIDAALSRAIEATNPFGKANTGNLGITYTVLKLTRAAYRAGKSLANAIKESIAQYRASNPAAQFNDDEVEAAVRIKLQDFLAGGEDALAIAKAAEPAVAENERAAAMIHAEEYHRQRISDRRKELNRLHDQAVQQALGNGIDVALVPKVTSSEFPEFAASLGMDAGLIQQLQGDVAREAKARRLSELQTQSEELNNVINKLLQHSPSKNATLIEQLTEDKAKLDKRIARKGFDDARARAAEILDHTREFVSRKARLEALNNPDVKEAISGPVQVLRDLMAEYPDLRDRGVSDWVSDPNITDEVKRVVVARLSTAFREFDKHHDNVATTLAASEASLERQINRLKERISKGEIRKAYIDIVIEEARLAAAGETGLTGGLGVDHLEWFDANAEALRSFARSLAEKLNGTGQDALDARKLSDWILFSPEDAPPAIKNTAQTNWGVGDETLNEIIKALQESPAVRNAVAAIYDKGTEKLPAHELRRIATIALSGEEADAEFAQYLAKQLQKKQGTELFKVVQRLRTDAKNLLDARVRLETLREALKLFQSVESSPVFKDARIETETQEGSFTRQMFVGDENSMTLRGFSGPEINQPEINIGGLSSFKPETKTAIESWRRSAAQYIAMYDLAQIESDMNPLAPHPITLGFDQAVYRGLQTALEESNILVDPSTYDDGSRIDEYKGITKNGQSWAINRQIDATTRMVEGIFGKNWQQKNKRYRDTKLKSVEILHNHGNGNIPALLSKAMASHPKIGGAEWLKAVPKFGPWFNETFAPGGNVSAYRRRVFDQIAHAARGNFVDSPKVGDVLPSGEVVTQADLDLVDQAIKYSNGLLKIAQDKRGTIQNFGTKELRRPAASVGVKGMARHIGVRGNGFVNAMLEAFKGNKDVSEFSPSDDLANGTSPWIQFWNTKAIHDDVLTNHVLDSVRGDRAITVSPYMRTAYEGLAANLIAEKYANRISNLEDLVAKLQVYFPSGTRLSAREYIIGELGKEFGQYVAQAKARKESIEKAELALNPISTDPNASKDLRKKSSSIVESETMNNEFTKPAADLILPSVYYEYGAITPTEMALAKDRATSEATIEMKHAMREAYAALYSYKVSIQDAANTDPLLADERDRVGFIMQQIHNLDLDIGRDLQQLNYAQKALKSGGSLLVGTALTAVGAVAGNVMSSGLPAYIFASRVSRLNRMALTMLAIKQSVRATKNLAYVLIDKAVGGYASSAFKALAKSKNPAMVMVADSITSMMDRAMKITGFMDAAGNWKDGRNDGYIQRGMQWAGFTNAAGVKSLGLSQTDRFISEVFNDVRGILQYANDEEQSKYRGALGKARLTGKVAAGVTASTIRNFSKMVGFESGDLAVNMASLSISDFMGRDLKDLAKRWATDRIAKIGDKFDESSKDWEVKPDEWLSGRYNREADQQNRLAGLRVAMSESGNQLENALWDYWKRSEGGTKDVDFFKDPDAFNRVVIGAVNANVYTNRPQRAQTNADQSMFQTLMNYTSDLAVKVMSAMKSVKSAKGMRKWFEILMRAIWGSIAALLVGLTTGAAREFVNRRFASKISREMTPMDKEFWTPDENLSKRLAMAAAYVLPGGQTFVNLAQLGRPDAASGNFWVSAINSVTAFLMGAMRIQSQDLPWLAKRALIKHFPFMEVILSNTSVNDTRQIGSGVNAYASAAKMAGIDRQNDAANAAGQQFTEKTPILAKINEAGMRAQIAREKGDEAGLQAALADIAKEKDRLVKFHKDALIEDNKRRGVTMTDFKVDQESIAAARKDWLSLNPIAKVLGHQPTSTEMERINTYLSGDRKAAADRAWNSYSGLAEFFPNGKGVANEPEMVKQERIAGLGRSGSGLVGGMSAGSLSASLRGGSVGVRRSGLRSRRGGISRLSRGIRSRRRSRGRTRGVRRIRF